MKKILTDQRVNEKVSFVINELTINGLAPTYAFRKCSEPFESPRFLTFESQLKKSNCFILLLPAI